MTYLVRIRAWCVLTLFIVFFAGTASAERWTFAVISDYYNAFASYGNVLAEIRDMKTNDSPLFPTIEFVLANGDISPAAESLAIYGRFFYAGRPVLFATRGNHEKPGDVKVILENILSPLGSKIRSFGAGTVNYYFDWKNVRVIVLDQYSGFSKDFHETAALNWIGEAIRSATDADHIFIAFHEPYIPHDPANDPLWKLLLSNKDKVRAVFVGHTHIFSRRQIPGNAGGIYEINSGNAGQIAHNDGKQTIVEVSVDEKTVYFRAVQAPNGTGDFKITDRWQIRADH